jgi:chromosome segregation ATPase
MKQTFKEFISEARRTDLTYTEEKVKGELSKVIAELSGSESGEATKLAKRYTQISKAIDKLGEKKTELNAALTEKTLALFDDATDAVCTRVAKTAVFTISVSKKTDPKEKKEVDYEKLFKAVTALLDTSLQPQLDALIKMHTKTWMENPKKPSLSVKALDESIASAATNKLAAWLTKLEDVMTAVVKSFKSWGKAYDLDLAALKRQLKA